MNAYASPETCTYLIRDNVWMAKKRAPNSIIKNGHTHAHRKQQRTKKKNWK